MLVAEARAMCTTKTEGSDGIPDSFGSWASIVAFGLGAWKDVPCSDCRGGGEFSLGGKSGVTRVCLGLGS